jgi:hypothetical protein
MNRSDVAKSPASIAWLTAGICVGVATLGWFGFRATREWQASARLLTERPRG